jgi:putative ABC transport system permease protein
MTMLRFAARNVFRHTGRSAITLAAIGFGVVALIVSGGFVENLYRQLGEAIIHSQVGHLQVAQPALFAEGSRSPEKHRIADLEEVKSELAGIDGVKQVAARLSFVGLLSNSRTDLPVIGEGIEPGKESELMSSIKVLAGRPLGPQDRHAALVGEGLAQSLALAPGDLVTFLVSTIDGGLNTAELEVVGVFRSFSRDYDARAVKIPLESAQELMTTQDANTIVLLLTDTRHTARALSQASILMQRPGLAVRSWEQLNDFYRNTVELYDRQFSVLKIVILFMVALGVGNAVNMAAFERLSEFGTMRALGNRPSQVVRLMMAECLLLGAIGAFGGFVIGAALGMLLSAIGIPMPPPPNSNVGYRAAIDLQPDVMLESAGVGFVAALIAGVIPALRAIRIPIVDALRRAV